MGCETRDRLSFGRPVEPNGKGPVIVIQRPGRDTTVNAGPAVLLQGTARDPDGVDSFYAEVTGGVTTFPPFLGTDSLFVIDLPITTVGQSGKMIQIRIFATDEAGNRGDTAVRVITVQ